jgi:hypothetical protein
MDDIDPRHRLPRPLLSSLSPSEQNVSSVERVLPPANAIAPLARRLEAKADQVWLFTRHFAVPWTNNASEQALKGPKRHQAVSGYWHTLTTLVGYCRVSSYLVSARGHGVRAIDAIHAALNGKPWLPTPANA